MHMKLKHFDTFHNTVFCKQAGCTRIFTDIYTFKKHLNAKHSVIKLSPKKVNVHDTFEVDVNDNTVENYITIFHYQQR